MPEFMYGLLMKMFGVSPGLCLKPVIAASGMT
jgi:hypothetical protein